MIRSTVSQIASALLRFHRDEQGAEGLEKLLIVAAVVLPLLGVLIYFRGQINDWVNTNWNTVHDSGTTALPPP